jgi:hypothetical protein
VKDKFEFGEDFEVETVEDECISRREIVKLKAESFEDC